jgi:transcriptional regulator GlxA family with amidase domain
VPTVSFLAFANMQCLDLAGPMDVFAEANRFLPASAHYQITTLGPAAATIRCSNGLAITPDATWAACTAPPDLLLVPGGPGLPGQQPDPVLSAWLRDIGMRSGRLASVCNGAFLLAHAGLLDGLHVTTHWNDASKLAARFPRVRVEPDRIFLRQGRIYTSAGVTAGIDLALHLVREDHGAELALNVAKRLVVFSQRAGGQSQFSPYLAPHIDNASTIEKVQDFVRAHLGEALSIDRLAQEVSMSARNFARVFMRDAQVTPAQFIERCRVDAARVLLETDNAPLKTIAHRCGFGTATSMRLAFSKHLGVTAQQYRRNFGAFRADRTAR